MAEPLQNDMYRAARVSGDTLVKTGAGFLHNVVLSQLDAVPTAGSITIYDNTAESGTALFTHTFTNAVFMPITVKLDVPFSTGLYVGFTTTADVYAVLSYK